MRRSSRWSVLIAAAAFLSLGAWAQTDAARSVTHYTPEQLAQHEEALAAQCRASGRGSCSEVLERHPGYILILGYRDKDGGAELHKNAADVDIVLDGSCTLVTGGVIQNAKDTGRGEVRGPGIEGGQKTVLQKGDIVQIPADTPHQMLLAPGGNLTYFVMKPTGVMEPTGVASGEGNSKESSSSKKLQ